MRIVLISILILHSLSAATVTVCSSGCTTTSLQTALDTSASCGDTIQIKSTQPQTAPAGGYILHDRGCSGGTPITVITDRSAWLPLAGARVTPSHLTNLAIIRTSDTAPAISGALTCGGASGCSAGVPPKHWIFTGIGFTSTNLGSFTYNLFIPKIYGAANNNEVPDDFTIDRCYFYTPLPNGGSTGVSVNQAIYAAISNLTVKDSFFGDFANPGFETHNIFFLTTPGTATIRNNFLVTAGIPIFSGGSIADYPVSPANIDVRYNYTWRPWKWNSDPGQPYYSQFLSNGSYAPCLKNHGEFKYADNIIWKYNGHENMWSQSQCQGQYPGFAMTVRTNWDGSTLDATMGNITMANTTDLSWSGTYNVITPAIYGNNVQTINHAVCVNFTAVGIICRPFSTFDNTAKTLTVSTAFSTTVGAIAGDWYSVYDPAVGLSEIAIENNIYKNVSRGVNNLGTSPNNGVGNAGRLINATVRNNLYWNSLSYMSDASFWSGYAAEESHSYDPSGYIIDHNTFFSPVQLHNYLGVSAIAYGTNTRQPKWNTWSMTNNLAGPDALYSVVGDGTTGNLDATMLAYMSSSSLKNNGFPGIGTGSCTGTNTCSGNVATTWSDPFVNSSTGLFVVKPGTVYSGVGTDGYNLGADFAKLPLIKNLRTTVAQKIALLDFDLSAPIQDAGSTQPCVLEVSSSQNLQTDLDTYTVINELNPAYFKQGDSTTGANPLLPLPVTVNAHVSWPIGLNATVTGDDSVSHDLRLTAGTAYYGRLMCYGDTQQFTFTTASSAGSATSFSVSQKVPVAYDTLRIEYGSSAALGSTVDATPDGSTRIATASVPITANAYVYWRPLFRASGVTLYTGPIRVQVN